jgi:hypothetical protein
MTNAIDVVRQVFPKVSDDEAGYLLWNRTAYPFTNNLNHIRRSLVGYKRNCDRGLPSCDHCNRVATKAYNKSGSGLPHLCRKCHAFLCYTNQPSQNQETA